MISPPKVYKGTWVTLEFVETVSYFLEIVCMLCVILSKGHHPNWIQNIFDFSENLFYSMV